jgi:hypothetical protein
MSQGAGSGDRLARGMSSAQFPPAVGVTKERWSEMFDDYNPEKFKKEGLPKVEGGEKEINKTS